MDTKQDTRIQKREKEGMEKVERTRAGKVFVPPIDIVETNEDIVLIADMPGVEQKSIDITVEQDVLTIEGRVEPLIPEGYDLTYCEYEIGDFQRSFTLTDTIDRDKIEAAFKNGVLKLRLPKAEPAKPKKIDVKVN
jgi:HSP20 family protein